jgi:Ca-activated chloride channel family protein
MDFVLCRIGFVSSDSTRALSKSKIVVARKRTMKNRFSIGCLVLIICFAASRAANSQTMAAPPRPEDPNAKIKMTVGLVVLHATTENHKGVLVSGLTKDNFEVFEDGVAQRIEVFSHEDIPVTVGLVVDGSGSMRPKHNDVVVAGQSFVKSSNPNDEMFEVNFNEKVSFGLPEETPFTNLVTPLQLAIQRSPISGETALYDAISAALDRLKSGTRDKKVLVVISDGGDNASKHTLKDVMTQAIESNAVIYTIGLFDESDKEKNPGVLRQLAHATGGEMYLPDTIASVIPICAQIARDIRNQYTIAYVPTNATADGGYRAIQVKVKAPGQSRLVVRTRAGYYAPGGAPKTEPTKTPNSKSASSHSGATP